MIQQQRRRSNALKPGSVEIGGIHPISQALDGDASKNGQAC
jgi:hypothetical protein